MKFSILISIISFLISFIIISNFESVYISFLSSFVIALFIFLLLRKIPKIIEKYRIKKIESDLPIALRAISIQLKMKVPFEEIIRSVSQGYNCSEEFRRILEDIESGMSVQDSLRKFGERMDSKIIKKVAMQLILAYESGSSGEEIKKIADELMIEQKVKMREFSANIGFLGLFYIGIACIAPILFITYITVASIFLNEKISVEIVKIVFLIGFPIIIFLMIVFIRLKTPYLVLSDEGLISKKEINLIDNELKKVKLNIKKFLLLSVPISIFLFTLSFYYFQIQIYYSVFLLFIPVFSFFLISYKIDLRNREIEEFLPDAIFQIASLEKVSFEKMIKNIGEANFGYLSEEFKNAYEKIKAGVDPQRALLEITRRNNSKILDRVIELLNKCYRIGREIHTTMVEVAGDIFEVGSLMKEQRSILALQKYTIFAGIFLLPIILASVINLISSLNYPQSRIPPEERFIILSTIKEVSLIYILIYVFFSSIFVSLQEGKKKNFIIYLLIFSFISIFLFNFSSIFIKP